MPDVPAAATFQRTPFAPVPGRARRRSPELAQLSREHHQALLQAIHLKRAHAQTARATRAAFLRFWDQQGNPHFIQEETVLIPTYARVADPDHPALVRGLLEHALIRARIAAIREASEPDAGELQQLGEWLERHVRHEERVLFPLIEDATGLSGS